MEKHKTASDPSPSSSGPPARSPPGHVKFGVPEASRGAPSPRAEKILTRKKTPFKEDVKSSLDKFRALYAAEAVVDAQQAVRAEENARLAAAPPPAAIPAPELLPNANAPPPADVVGAKKPPRSVIIVSPPSAAAAAAAAVGDEDNTIPTILPDKNAPSSS